MTSLSPVCNPFLSFDRSVMETLDLILNLTKAKGYCFARNEWLAAQMGVKPVTISRRISQLVKAGLLFWQRVGKARHLFPAFPVPADSKSPSEAIEQMIRQRYAKSKPTPKTHAGAANQQTLETKDTFGENKQQAAASPESSPASPVVVSSAKAFPEGTTPRTERSASGFQSVASILQAIPEPNRGERPGADAETQTDRRSAGPLLVSQSVAGAAPGTPEVRTPTGTRPPSPVAAVPEVKQAAPGEEANPEAAPAVATPGEAAASEAKPEAKPEAADRRSDESRPVSPVADLEIVSALQRRAGMGLRAAQVWAAKQPAECLRLLAALGKVSGVRDKAAWIIAALRDAEAGKPYAFIAPPVPKAPPKAAQEGEIERRQQKRLEGAEAQEKAAEAAYEAIAEPERERLEAQAVASLPFITRRQWEAGSRLGREAVRAAVLKLAREKP